MGTSYSPHRQRYESLSRRHLGCLDVLSSMPVPWKLSLQLTECPWSSVSGSYCTSSKWRTERQRLSRPFVTHIRTEWDTYWYKDAMQGVDHNLWEVCGGSYSRWATTITASDIPCSISTLSLHSYKVAPALCRKQSDRVGRSSLFRQISFLWEDTIWRSHTSDLRL